jgi:AcrR family transcriptional regulator
MAQAVIDRAADGAPVAGKSARERLLDAADELFYDEGIRTVGIDRVIEHAGVAKATLYKSFGSKDELIRAYLERRHQSRQAHLVEGMARHRSPKGKLLSVFDVLDERIARPAFRGCAFVNASAEAQPDSVVARSTATYRSWMRALIREQVLALPATKPDELTQQLLLLYDGAMIAASIDRNRASARAAKAAATTLIDAAIRR